MDEWTGLTDWWLDEIDAPAYEEEVIPLFFEVLPEMAGHTVLDLGCGEGRMFESIETRGARPIGVDVNLDLARLAAHQAPVALTRLPSLRCFGDATVDGSYVVLALEHIHDSRGFFAETARVVRPGGWLAVVLNHPVYTAPHSGPILDPTDGELFWRFGDYLTEGATREPAGAETVEFVHRPVGVVLNEAAESGWRLDHVVEQGVGAAAAARDSLLAKHHEIPHLMAIRWSRPGI